MWSPKSIRMKKILFSVFTLLLFAVGIKAQGNLQFNQIILLDIASGATQAITVPANKVWKIESVGTGTSSNPNVDLRNSSAVSIAHFASMTGTGATAAFPFWLPAGFSGSFINFNSARSCISIIEFNVIP